MISYSFYYNIQLSMTANYALNIS